MEHHSKVEMKKIVSILLLLMCYVNGYAQKKNTEEFVLHGKVTGRDTGRIVLGYVNKNGKGIVDTTYLKNGKFTFMGPIDQPTIASLIGKVKSKSVDDPDYVRIFLEPKRMNIALTEHEYKQDILSGSYTQSQYDTLNMQLVPVLNMIKPLDTEFEKLAQARNTPDTSTIIRKKMDTIRDKLRLYDNLMHKTYYRFGRSHPDSYVSAWILLYLVDRIPADSAKVYYSSLSPQVQNSRYGIDVYKSLQAHDVFLKSKRIGSRAPLFVLRDRHDKTISLSSFHGKSYVLLDFWASWCIPCRESAPHLKRIYQQYHAKGLDVISLSLDYNNKAWSRALSKDGMNWYNVFLNKDKQHDLLSEKYGVTIIPEFILIDKRGIIIGKWVGLSKENENELDEKLDNIFNK